MKSDFILSLCELIIGGKTGLEPVEKTIIDRCVRLVYRDYLADPHPDKMPILEDLYNLLRRQSEQEAQRIATSLEIYVVGSLNVFNHRTNVDITNRLVCYDIKELGKGLKKIAMLVLQDQVWGRVTANRAAKCVCQYKNTININEYLQFPIGQKYSWCGAVPTIQFYYKNAWDNASTASSSASTVCSASP